MRESLEVHDDFGIGSALAICSQPVYCGVWALSRSAYQVALTLTLTLPPFLAESSFRRKQETKNSGMKSEYTPTLYDLSNSLSHVFIGYHCKAY